MEKTPPSCPLLGHVLLFPGRSSCSGAQEQRSAPGLGLLLLSPPCPTLLQSRESSGVQDLLSLRGGRGVGAWHRAGTDPPPADVPACSPPQTDSVRTEPVLPAQQWLIQTLEKGLA